MYFVGDQCVECRLFELFGWTRHNARRPAQEEACGVVRPPVIIRPVANPRPQNGRESAKIRALQV
jgi:hypothetical protein